MRHVQPAAAFCFLSVALIYACASAPIPQGGSRKPQSLGDFTARLTHIARELDNPKIFNEVTCASYLHQLTSSLYAQDTVAFAPKNQTETQYLLTNGKTVVKQIFAARLRMRERFQEFDALHPGNINPDCVSLIRRANRHLRVAEEYVAEWLYARNVGYFPEPTREVMAGEMPQLMLNPKFGEKLEIKSGDILLMRGSSFIGATIARIADEDGQFSQSGIVYIEPKTGKRYILESLIETGFKIIPWEEIITKNSRAVLYRHSNTELAAKVAQSLFDQRFTQNKTKPSPFASSEMIEMAFRIASHDQTKLGTYKSTLTRLHDTKFLKDKLEIVNKSAFFPSDFELEPQVEMVAEFRYYPDIRKMRRQDAIFSGLFRWMRDGRYDLNTDVKVLGATKTARDLSAFGLLDPNIRKTISPNFAKAMVAVNDLIETLEPMMITKEAAYFKVHGYAPAYTQFLDWLEEIRKEDCLVKDKKIFEYLRPTFIIKGAVDCDLKVDDKEPDLVSSLET